MANMNKSNMGRQKIKMSKIQNKTHLQVTFSKRRSGIFKKASELTTLCGVEIAIIIFSPAGKVFSFGHPNVDSIIDRFITRKPKANCNTSQFIEARQNASIQELNFLLTQVVNELEAENQKGQMLDKIRKAGQSQFWWEAPVEKLNLYELEQLKASFEELKKIVTVKFNQVYGENFSNGFNVCEPIHIDNPSVHNFNYGYGFF